MNHMNGKYMYIFIWVFQQTRLRISSIDESTQTDWKTAKEINDKHNRTSAYDENMTNKFKLKS